jgi:hypothetical protein
MAGRLFFFLEKIHQCTSQQSGDPIVVVSPKQSESIMISLAFVIRIDRLHQGQGIFLSLSEQSRKRANNNFLQCGQRDLSGMRCILQLFV